jgi:uncharacterized protein (TIGR03435 family)
MRTIALRVVLYGIAIPVLLAPAAGEKEYRFEAVSMRPAKFEMGVPMNTGPSPGGYVSRMSLWQLIMVAYTSEEAAGWGNVEVRNSPKWIGDFYDIRARVSQTDLNAWQGQGKDHELLRSALRSVLQERCNLALHEEPAKRTIFELVVVKRGARLKPADLKAPLPDGVKLSSGGVMTGIGSRGENGWDFHAATMHDLANMMIQVYFDGPVRDRTGLTGHYDFQARRIPTPGENHGFAYDVASLGLKLKRGLENRPILVIDHIEKPTSN